MASRVDCIFVNYRCISSRLYIINHQQPCGTNKDHSVSLWASDYRVAAAAAGLELPLGRDYRSYMREQ